MEKEQFKMPTEEELKSIYKNDFINDNTWILMLLLLVTFGLHKEEEKQPIINIYVGGDNKCTEATKM